MFKRRFKLESPIPLLTFVEAVCGETEFFTRHVNLFRTSEMSMEI